MTGKPAKFVGETPKVIYDRTKLATSRLLSILMEAHAGITATAPEMLAPALPAIEKPAGSPPRRPVPKSAIGQVQNIQRAVLTEYPTVSVNDLRSKRRMHEIVKPRQIAMYLAKVLTNRSLPEIGRLMGGRDHTTVLHGYRKIEKLILSDPGLAARIERIKSVFEEMQHEQHSKAEDPTHEQGKGVAADPPWVCLASSPP